MAEIAIISDTHVPSRADGIPDWIAERVREADHTIHAGDFEDAGTHERVAELADGDLTAVRGNVDSTALDLPWVAATDLQGTTFVVTHGHRSGPDESYRDGVARAVSEAVEGPAIAVAGHTHEVVDEDVEGIRLLNPGSATGAAPADRETMLSVEIVEGDLDVRRYEAGELVER
ncbi:YfcE family phosphodiesterase [Halobacteriales archaeon QS_1_67_19]|nr:MAG: YfcE family phosphodiesterase [Halobacteriales archaeon QS_1_67_19]